MTVATASGSDIWVHHLDDSTKTRLTFDGKDNRVSDVTADGKDVVYRTTQTERASFT